MRKLYPAFNKHIFSSFIPKVIPFRKLCFLFTLFLVAGLNTYAQPGAGWEYSRNIAIVGGTGTPVADYQIKVTLTVGQYTNMNSDGSDLRFYAGATPCNFWIENWNTGGQSVIWVNVPAANTTAVTMYYGNPVATSAVSPGTDVFDFFDDFNTPINSSIWDYSGTQSGSAITLQQGDYISNKNPFPIAAGSSYFLETKHNEGSYYRVRYYATTITGNNGTRNGAVMTGITNDYGYFSSGSAGASSATVFWNGTGFGVNPVVNAGTDYITQWQITDNGAFKWNTLLSDYSSVVASYPTSLPTTTFRYITIAVTEGTASTSVDWIRVRKSGGATDPVSTVDPQVQLSPSVTSYTQSLLCSGGIVNITITGNNFDNTSAVTFNGVTAQSYIVNSRTQITATSQAGVTGGAISITTPGGNVTSASLAVQPLPGLFNVAGGGSYCAGGTGLPITLSGSESGISYQLLQDNTPIGTAVGGTSGALNFGNQTANAAYTVLATNTTTGCNQTMTGAPTVVTNPLPTAYNVTGAGNFCSGGSGLAVGLDGSQAGINYQLYLGSNPVGTAKPGTGSALSFGNQTVAGTYTVKAGNTSTGCANDMTGSAVVTVNPLPTGTIAVTETSGNGPANDGKICLGDPITFTAPAGYSSYTFKINGTPVSPQPGSNIYTTSSLAVGAPVVTVEVIDANGCHGTLNTAVQVSVSSLPTGTFAPSVNNVCPLTQVTFNAPTGYTNYVFKVNGGSAVNRGTLSNYSYTTLVNGDVVSVDVTNSNGCMTNFTAVPMVFKPLPGNSSTITGTAQLCAGTNNVTYSVPAIANATSYAWTLPTGASGTSTGNSINVNFSNTSTTGNITVAGVNGCGNGISSSFQVIVNPVPAATISGTSTLCQNAAAPTITFTGSLGTAPYTFSYNINGGGTQTSVSTGNAATLSPPTNVAGTFAYNLLSVKDASATTCSSTITGASETVTVNPMPLAPATPTGTAAVCQATMGVAYHVAAITYADATGYHWTYSGTGATINGNTKDITIDFASNATSGDLTVYGQNSCGVGTVSAVYHITVNPLPTASIANDANPAECKNSPVKPGLVFTGAGGTAPYTFTYTVNGGANQTISTTGGNSSVTFYQPTTTAGTFTFALVSVQDNSSTHCANPQTGSVNAIIHELPVPVLNGPSQICPNDISDYSTQTGQANYVWTINGGSLNLGGSTSDPTAQVHWNNDNLPKSIYVNYTDANGCSGNTSVSVISTAPTTPAFNTSGAVIVCLNSTGNVYQVQSGYSDYVWSITGGTITSGGNTGGSTTNNTATVTWNTAGPGTISVNFNSGLCSAPAPTAYAVTVNTLPTATVTTNNAAVCQNETSPVVTFTGADGAANYTFSYTINGVAQTDIVSSGNTQTVAVPTAVTPGDYIYKLTNVLDNNICSQPQSNAVTVTVNPLPVGAISSGTTAVCAGSSEPNITFTGSVGTAPYTFTYTINGGSNQTVATTSGNSITVAVPTGTPGNYDYTLVSVQDANGCMQTATGTATITVNPLPTATMTGPAALCLNDVDNITFTGANGTTPYTFTYTIDGGSNLTITTSGNAVTVPINTTSAHNFTYKLISVQDGSSTACVQNQTGTVSVIVSAVSVGGTLTGDATVCTGTNSGTITLGADKIGNVVRWESSIDGGITWSAPIPNTTSSLTYTNLTTPTQYRAIVQSGTCTEAASNAVTITVNTAVGGTVTPGPSGTGTICAGTNGSVALTGNSGPVLQWEYSFDGITWIVDATKHDPYYNFTNIAQTTWYRALTQAAPCDAVYSTVQKETVNPRPTATISGVTPICIGGSTTLTLNLTGAGTMNGIVTDGTNNYPFTGTSANPVVLTGITPATSSSYTISTLTDANCVSTGVTYLPNYATVTVNPLPSPVVITPGNTTICSGTILPLSSVENYAGNFTFNQTSSPNVTIPDNNPSGASDAITVPAGTIPVGGVVDSVQVTMNVQHPEVNDLAINLGSPDGKVITFAAYSLYGPNLTNTIISSRTSQYPVVTTGSSPYSGTYSAEGDNIYGAEVGNANTRKFTDLFGTVLAPPNGNWTLYLTDNWAGNTGILQNWTLTIYYHVPVNPINIVWSPLDSLFTDPSATIPYTGDARQTVYAKPSATTIYTGKAEDANSCTTASDVTITVTPAPEVTVVADYCSVPNKVQLTASSVPAASSYVWNTGETTSAIAVDEAKLYTVAATTGLHCVGTGFLSVAQELVKNGNFEAGNTGFLSEYGYVAPGGSLVPEGLYAVDTNAHNYHPQFFGKDHTTPAQTGKFMIVNGNPSTDPRIIWQETLTVLPNTNYYYSAWAMNLNNVAPFAKLQFSVNGVPIGTIATNGIADLSTAPKPASTADVNIDNWVRFYYGNTNGWFSGSNTTAIVRIIDLTPDANGNDYGLDDISFATLSTFIRLTSATGTDDQTVCRGDTLNDITYSVGSGGTPTVTGLPNGVTSDFKNGITLTISGIPNDNSGVYTYTITTTGACANPTTATGQITVNGQKVTLSSSTGTDSQIVCKGTPITPIKYTLSQLATGAVVTGLPAGVSASPVSGNVITITGSPQDSGTFTYKIKTIGSSCNADSLTGTIRSNVQTIVKTSGDDDQTLCINNDMTAIIYTIGGTGTGISATPPVLPAGVTGIYAGGTYTISGKPTVSGIFDYTITTDGTCDAAAITGRITVSSDATVNLSSPSGSDAQIICYNAGIGNITYNTTGAPDAGITVTGLPNGLSYAVNSGVVTITGVPTESGSFTYTVKAVGACVEASINGAITIDALVNTGTSFTANYTQLCSVPSGTLTLNGSSGAIDGWEYSIDAGNTWNATSPVSTTNVLNFAINSKTYFRAVFDGGACGDSYSSPYVIGIHNLWTGEVSTDWNDANNWSDGNIPSVSCPDVVIPQVPTSNYPVLASGMATINNLQIKSSASLTVNGTGKFQVAGNVTNAGVFDATAATIEFNGPAAQVTDGNTFKSNTIQNVIVSNASGLSVASTAGDTMKISGSLTFGDPNATINTGNNITLLSTALATANVGVLNTGNSITGNVTVERYVAAINNWQFLAVPTQTTQTIHQAWQENLAPGSIGQVGYGTNITGPSGTGFDFLSPNYSVRYWDYSINNYRDIMNTGLGFPNIKNGFYVFIRGDRQATALTSSVHIPTVMRTTGPLNIGPVNFSIPGNTYYSVGNPYASRVDFRNIAGIGGIGSTFYVWDPLIYGTNGAGGYQTFSDVGAYKPLVPTAYYDASTAYPYLESGQAVFVNNVGGSTVTITFNESAKTTGSHLVFRADGSLGSQFFRTYLYTSSGKIADGNTVAFNSEYQNRIDGNDAVKIRNTGENLGLRRDGIVLAIEARAPLTASDTIYFDLKNVSRQSYRFQFSPEDMENDGLKAYLVDNYLKTKTEVSLGGISSFDFTVNSDAASYAADRFMIVFKQSEVLPITFVSLAASQKDKNIIVEWNVKNEQTMLQYDVEKSVDGINFVKKETVPANNSGSASYQWTDKDTAPGNNYYRIRSVDKNGKVVYSTVVNVLISNFKSSISIYPNPITDGIIHLQFVNQAQGRYGIRLLNPLGQLIVWKQIEFAGGNGSEGIKWDYNLAHGVYQLEIIKPDKNVEVIRVMY